MQRRLRTGRTGGVPAAGRDLPGYFGFARSANFKSESVPLVMLLLVQAGNLFFL